METLVGDSSLPILGRLDKIHLPLMMRDNQLHAYVMATGGDYDAEFRQRGIEKSFAKIAAQVRNQYTVGYYSHEPSIDGKYRKLEVRVSKPDCRSSPRTAITRLLRTYGPRRSVLSRFFCRAGA